MDRRRLSTLSGIHGRSLQRVFCAVVRDSQSIARRLLGDAIPAAAEHLAQLLPARPARRLGGLSYLRTASMKIILVTPAPPGSRKGNRVTALRWARLLRELGHRVAIQQEYRGERGHLLIALHARRSFPAVRAWRQKYPDGPVILALTGTDLYGEIQTDADARRALDLATRVV